MSDIPSPHYTNPSVVLTVLKAIALNKSWLSLHVFAASTFAALSSLGSVIDKVIYYKYIYLSNNLLLPLLLCEKKKRKTKIRKHWKE